MNASRAAHRAAPVLTPEALEALGHYNWPGNVRDLENCLTRAIVVARGNVIRPEHLAIGGIVTGAPSALPTLDAVECAHVERVLASTGGNKAETARTLGVSRPRLDRLLKKHGLQ
jgi:DNA-binding NtrC family response regulator